MQDRFVPFLSPSKESKNEGFTDFLKIKAFSTTRHHCDPSANFFLHPGIC